MTLCLSAASPPEILHEFGVKLPIVDYNPEGIEQQGVIPRISVLDIQESGGFGVVALFEI